MGAGVMLVPVNRAHGYGVAPVDGSDDFADRVAHLLNLLPAWFGRPEANAEYVETARQLGGFTASTGDDVIGVVVHRRHFPESAEIDLIAVSPHWHGRGVGRALMQAVEKIVRADGCTMLQVKTLGASHSDPGYARTREFYRAVGFLRVEEFHDLWPGTPCLLLVKFL